MNVANVSLILEIRNNIEHMNNTITKNNEKLAAGVRINTSSDDASGLRISEKMRSQIKGLDMAVDNATDGISMIQTAEGGLTAINELLNRMNELSIKAVNGVNTKEDIRNIYSEYEHCKKEIDRIAETTLFNGRTLLNVNTGETKIQKGTSMSGDAFIPANAKITINFSTIGDGNEFTVKLDNQEHKFVFTYNGRNSHSGNTTVNITGKETNYEKAKKLEEAIENTLSNVKAETYMDYPDDGKNYILEVASLDTIDGQTIELDMKTNAPIIRIGNKSEDIIYLELNSVTTKDLDIENTDINTKRGAKLAGEKITQAIEKITQYRGKLGTAQNQMEYAIKRIIVEQENVTASESRIYDVNMAEEMVRFAKNKIIQETAISMLAQANIDNDMVLNLLENREAMK